MSLPDDTPRLSQKLTLERPSQKPVVMPVIVDDEPQSTARRTHTDAFSYQSGAAINVEIDGVWRECWIVGSQYSVLRVRTS